MNPTAEKFQELVGRIQAGDIEAVQEAQPLFRQMMTAGSGLKYPDPELRDVESRERTAEYLDQAIHYWRTYRDVTRPSEDNPYSDAMQYREARIYVDAFQCVRASLLGEVLEDKGIRCTAAFQPLGVIMGAEPEVE